MNLWDIKDRPKKKLAKIEAKQAKEYQELFPPTCSRIEQAYPSQASEVHPNRAGCGIFQDLGLQWTRAERGFGRNQLEGDQWQRRATGGLHMNRQCGRLVGLRADPEQVSARRGPPTDRPPDKPPPCEGASRGCLQERAGTRHVSQLASFTRGPYSLSGNATSLQTMQFEVCAPSNYSASSAADSSQGTR
jgi:hypothetical protein